MTNIIEQVSIGGNLYNIASTAYAICETPAATASKVATIGGFKLTEGVTVHIKFLNSNTAPDPTLNVNGTGEKLIMQYGTTKAGTAAETSGWQAGAVVSFTYDGVNWVRDQGYNTNNTYTIKDTYSDTDGDPISGKGVKAALETLDVTDITGFSAAKTLKTLSETDGKISATFQNIKITESQVTNLTTDLDAKAPVNSPTFEGTVTLPGDPTSNLHAATKQYVDNKTAGLSSAMHFIGITSTELTNGATTSPLVPKSNGSLTKTTGFASGDVVIYSQYEFVWTGSAWELLGGNSSYALDSAVIKKSIIAATGNLIYGNAANDPKVLAPNTTTTEKVLYMKGTGTDGSAPAWKEIGINTTAEKALTDASINTTNAKWPTLKTGTAFSVPNVTSMTTAAVNADAVLVIENGAIAATNFSIPNATGINAGTWPIVQTTKTVDFLKTASIKYT